MEYFKYWLFSQISNTIIPFITVDDHGLNAFHFVTSLDTSTACYICFAVSVGLLVFVFVGSLCV